VDGVSDTASVGLAPLAAAQPRLWSRDLLTKSGSGDVNADVPARWLLKTGHRSTSTITLAKRVLFSVSVTVMVWFPFLRRSRPLKVCAPLSAAVKV